MAGTWRPLPWDSDFFGVGIGWIDLTASAADVRDAETEARAAGIACLYGSLDPVDPSARLGMVHERGYHLVDVVLDLEHPTSVLVDPPPTTSVIRPGTSSDVEALAPLIATVAPWSRFAVDDRFGLACATALHLAWIERALRGDDGRAVLVAHDASGLTGVATVRTPATDPVDGAAQGRIDLIATTAPGSGAAQALVAHAYAGFGPGRSRGGPIAARNVASLRFCEQMGLRTCSTRYLYHRWLDPRASAVPPSSTL